MSVGPVRHWRPADVRFRPKTGPTQRARRPL